VRTRALFLFLMVAGPIAGAQVTAVHPGQAGGPVSKNYGDPRFEDLQSVSNFDRLMAAHVWTEGEVTMYGGPDHFWLLREGGASVLLICGSGVNASDLDEARGRRVRARGIVRAIREKRFVRGPDGRQIDLDLIEDPGLPPLPSPAFDQGMPRVSLTLLALEDREYDNSFERRALGSGRDRGSASDLTTQVGRTITIVGQFRGRNLFADLPAASARTKEDCVLKDGDAAMWITGKAPKGEGFKLALDAKADCRHWLEVQGRVEIVDDLVYIRARRVSLSSNPAARRPAAARQP